MLKKIFYPFLFIVFFISSSNEVYSGKHSLSVKNFGGLAVGDHGVDFDQVHSNLHRFEAHTSQTFTAYKDKNNVAVGAVTVVFGDPGSHNPPRLVKTFYFELHHPHKGRGLVAFESTPEMHDERLPWEKSGLGMIDGHSHITFEPEWVKSLNFASMLYFFSQLQSDPRNPEHPSQRMGKPYYDLTHTSKALRLVTQSLRELLGPLTQAQRLSESLLTHKLIGSNDSSDPDLELVDIEDDADPNVSTDARDYVYSVADTTEDLLSHLGELSKRNEEIEAAIQAQQKLRVDMKTAATAVYHACWHSETRLCHYLLPPGEDEDSDDASSSASESTNPETPTKPYGFDWSQLRAIGGDLVPKVVFFHVHSRRMFCPMCEFTLSTLLPDAIASQSYLGNEFRIGGVLGSYSEGAAPVDPIDTIPWERTPQTKEGRPCFFLKSLGSS